MSPIFGTIFPPLSQPISDSPISNSLLLHPIRGSFAKRISEEKLTSNRLNDVT
jgi:hypothetical protein